MIGDRIQRARKALGFSLRDLGKAMGLSHAAIKKYEDNKTIPSSGILQQLSQVLRVKIDYFFRQAHFVLEKIQYRKHADMPEKHLEAITAKILDQVERRVELENLFPTPPVQSFSVHHIPKVIGDGNDIERLADQIRHQWNLGLEPIPDLIDIFEEHGIKVFAVDNSEHPKFDGLYADVNGMPVVVVGSQWPAERQRFTLAHELGHLLLDHRLALRMNVEESCNHFAGAFLLPKQSLIKILGTHRYSIEPRELNLLKQEFGISMTSILHRAEETRIISEGLYRQLRSEFHERGWSKKEPGEAYPKQKTRIFEKMIFRALAEKYIGETKAAELMELSLEAFRSLRAMESQDANSHYH